VPENLERRILSPEDIELRVDDGDKPKLSGYAAKYGILTDLGWFKERIKSGAFDEALKDADVRCLKNHDPNLILGRTTSGTLRLQSNTVGLKFEDDVPDTTTGKDILEEVRRGDISGCSFAFTVAEQTWKYFEDDSPPERTIITIAQLYDVGPVTYPAYKDTTVKAREIDTTVAMRSLDAFKESEKKQEEDEKRAEEPKQINRERQREIERGYRKAGRILNRCRSAEV
jgi:HK97 family phage prohead protease